MESGEGGEIKMKYHVLKRIVQIFLALAGVLGTFYGTAFLAMAGPVGWTIGGATLLASSGHRRAF